MVPKKFKILTMVTYYKQHGGVIATRNKKTASIISLKLTACPEITEHVVNDIMNDNKVNYFIDLTKTPIDDNVLKTNLILFK